MFNDAALVVAATALDAAITHLQLHSGARGAAGTTNAVGARVAVNGSVDGDGDITWSAAFTGLPSNQAVAEVSYWSASAGGTYYGGAVLSAGGDLAANAAGQIDVTVVESSTGA